MSQTLEEARAEVAALKAAAAARDAEEEYQYKTEGWKAEEFDATFDLLVEMQEIIGTSHVDVFNKFGADVAIRWREADDFIRRINDKIAEAATA